MSFPQLSESAGLLWHPDNLVNPARLRHLVSSKLPYELLEHAAIPVHVMATNLRGFAVSFARGPAVDTILASAAIPGIFPPVEIGNEFYMDGAVATNAHICMAAELGGSRIVVLPTGYACALKEPPNGAIAKALHAVTLMVARQLIHDLERLPAVIDVHVAPPLCPLQTSPFDFSAARALIDPAEPDAAKWIADGGLTRRTQPRELAAHRH